MASELFFFPFSFLFPDSSSLHRYTRQKVEKWRTPMMDDGMTGHTGAFTFRSKCIHRVGVCVFFFFFFFVLVRG